MTIKQAAIFLGIGQPAITMAIRLGRLAGYKIGKRFLLRKGDVLGYSYTKHDKRFYVNKG
jgi:excisionase family DNA binding protein